MKKKQVILLISLVLFLDQLLKIYIKTTFPLHAAKPMLGDWFQLYFVENPGMAYGWKWGGNTGKIVLTLFRIGAVGFGVYYLKKIIREHYHRGFIFCVTLIFAGAIGNLIDSCFYGLIFDKGMVFNPMFNEYMGYQGLAAFSQQGYSKLLQGNVVDMLYFPIIRGNLPDWLPIWGGDYFEFFQPVFNLADAAISGGVISIVVFQKVFFREKPTDSQIKMT
jgi:signal peptidase II